MSSPVFNCDFQTPTVGFLPKQLSSLMPTYEEESPELRDKDMQAAEEAPKQAELMQGVGIEKINNPNFKIVKMYLAPEDAVEKLCQALKVYQYVIEGNFKFISANLIPLTKRFDIDFKIQLQEKEMIRKILEIFILNSQSSVLHEEFRGLSQNSSKVDYLNLLAKIFKGEGFQVNNSLEILNISYLKIFEINKEMRDQHYHRKKA